MRLVNKLFVVLFITIGVVNCQTPDDSARLPVDSNVITGKLANGLTYYIRANKKPEKRAELRLAVNVGSVLEDDDQRGLAHFCEHMAFNGTKHFKKQELVNYLESVGMSFGADLNAYTNFDETVYMLKIPTDSASIVGKAFQILEDWAHDASYDDDEIDKERGVVIEEWRLGRGAEARMRDKQYPVLFRNSRYSVRMTIGDKRTLETCSHETLKKFYRDWYRPELMAVVATGDFDPREIEGMIKSHFAGIPAAVNARERILYPVPDHDEPLFAIASDSEATSSRVGIYYKHDPEPSGTVGDYRRSIVEELYSGILNNRLSELSRSSDPPFLFAFSGSGRFVRTKDVYFLSAGIKDNGIEQGLNAILTEAERVKKFGFDSTELDREKKETLRSMENAFNERDKTESSNYADELVRNFLTGEPVPGIGYELQLYRELLPGISLGDVDRLAGKWIIDKNRVVLVNLPEKKGLTPPTDGELAAVFASVGGTAIAPYVDRVSNQPLIQSPPKAGSIVGRKETKELGTTEWKLSNGARVILKPTEFKNDEVDFTAFSPGGSSLAPEKDFIAVSTASSIVKQSGIGQFDETELEKLLAGKLVRVSPYIGELDEGLSGGSTPQDVETLFQLIHLYLTSPRSDTAAFRAYKERVRSFLQNRSAQPEAAFSDTIQVTMSQYHPRRRPWTLATLDEMSLQSSLEEYRERFADISGFTFVFVGNLDLAVLAPLVETYLGSLPPLNRNDRWKDIGISPPKGVVEKSVKKGIEPKSQVRIMFTGPFEWSQEHRHQIQSMASVLEIKLREVLREEKGGTYGVGVSAVPTHYPAERYSLSVSFGCAPERVDELVKAAFGQIDSLKNFEPAETYIQKVKEIQKREREESMKENGSWLRALQFVYSNQEDPMSILTYQRLIDKLSAKEVQDAAQRYFNLKNYVKIVLYPQER